MTLKVQPSSLTSAKAPQSSFGKNVALVTTGLVAGSTLTTIVTHHKPTQEALVSLGKRLHIIGADKQSSAPKIEAAAATAISTSASETQKQQPEVPATSRRWYLLYLA